MSGAFHSVMARMPQIMAGFAVLFYVTTVFIAIVSGNEFSDAMGTALPASLKLKMFLIVFVQPLVSVAALLFGAGLLWRLDRLLTGGFVKGSAE